MERLRRLPSVDAVLGGLEQAGRFPHAVVVDAIRSVIEERRRAILEGKPESGETVEDAVRRRLAELEQCSLRRVINATGVVLHTNLGRAPLGQWAPISGYSNLEYDLAAGARGKRDVHAAVWIERLLGYPGIVVNNNAAAVFLALNELAAGGEVIVSRGELIEIGDGFRMPEIMQRSGAILREVGTTNRTTAGDYRAAVNERTRLLMRVHRSNFRMEGFTSRPSVEELAAIARQHGVPLYEDLGSGCLVDLRPYGIDEPPARASLDAGADLISFSGDKLLGGPQAGILAGRPELIRRIRRNPLFRALRVDKLTYQALERTLMSLVLERYQEIPALAMIMQPADRIRQRAEALASRIPGAKVAPGRSLIGGGSTPEQSLDTWLILLEGDPAALQAQLRRANPPVVARIENDRLALDLRTVFESEEEELLQALSR
jgi:L-seryl-tRNA(Ser) seleniumtransferase